MDKKHNFETCPCCQYSYQRSHNLDQLSKQFSRHEDGASAWLMVELICFVVLIVLVLMLFILVLNLYLT